MDQDREINEISEIEEIKHMLIELSRTQTAILERLEQMAHAIDEFRSRFSGK